MEIIANLINKTMPIKRKELEDMLREEFPDAKIDMKDLAGDDDHWSLEIASAKFNGLSRVQQHKLVYNSLQGKMGGQLHALQLKTKTLN